MTIRESLYFIYDGISSQKFNIINVSTTTGLQEESFYAEREIVEHVVRGRNKPYFQEIRERPLAFDVEFAFEEIWDNEKIREVARWLIQDYYKELYFSDNPNRRYYAIVSEDPRLIHNSLKQGYIRLRFRCDSPYTYSPQYEEIYDLSSNPSGTDITFTNHGDKKLFPELHIYKTGVGDVSIKNHSNGGKEFKVSNLNNMETVYFDNEDQYIESDTGFYRYDNHNGNWLELLRGKNNLHITGECELKLVFKYKTIQG